MTRFARAAGSKSSNKKLPEDGTPWEVLKDGLGTSGSNQEESSESDEEKQPSNRKSLSDNVNNSWSIIESPQEDKSREGVKRKSDTVKSKTSKKIKSDFSSTDDQNETTQEDDEPSNINDSTINKGGKKSKNNKSKKCFQCQQMGHILSECPGRNESDLCFICGSTEHKFRDCKLKNSSKDKFKYATCFICKEQGHISSSCPDNPQGLYPHGGGCHSCGDVTHFARDCPKKQEKKASSSKISVSTISDDVEGLPDDKPKSNNKIKSKKVKVVKF